MKKLISVLLMLCLTLALCACGKTETPAPTAEPAPAVTPAPTAEPVPEPTPAVETTDVGMSEEPDLYTVAKGFEGKSLSELIAAIGEPLSSDYAPSCLGSGEDGLLEYDGFAVYTYREGDTERVDTVLPD